ncbi:hypothetical protein ACU686_44630 [Yinghuangia aomiensis]
MDADTDRGGCATTADTAAEGAAGRGFRRGRDRLDRSRHPRPTLPSTPRPSRPSRPSKKPTRPPTTVPRTTSLDDDNAEADTEDDAEAESRRAPAEPVVSGPTAAELGVPDALAESAFDDAASVRQRLPDPGGDACRTRWPGGTSSAAAAPAPARPSAFGLPTLARLRRPARPSNEGAAARLVLVPTARAGACRYSTPLAALRPACSTCA